MDVVQDIKITSVSSSTIELNITPIDGYYDYIQLVCSGTDKDKTSIFVYNKTSMFCSSLSPAINYTLRFYTNRDGFTTQQSEIFYAQTSKLIKRNKTTDQPFLLFI